MNSRGRYQKKMRQSMGSLQKAAGYLIEVGETFKPVNKEVHKCLVNFSAAIMVMADELDKFRRKI